METVKYIVKAAILKVVVLYIALFYSSLVALAMLVKRLIKGKGYWYVKERTLPPLILQDAKWGRHSHVNLKYIKLHYVENGDRSKPLMLFIHGFPEFWFSWRKQMQHFSQDYWVVALDMRGYGDSEKPKGVSAYGLKFLMKDIHNFVKALQKDKCILVAHDWGGVVGWGVASLYPEIVEKLVILNAPHPSTLMKKMMTSLKQFLKSWYMFAFQIPFLPETYFHTQDLEVFRDMFYNKISEEELEAYKYNWSRPGAFTPPLNYYRNLFSAEGTLKVFNYPIIEAPTMLIWGENDIAFEKSLAEMARKHVKNLKIKYIPDGSHFVQTDKADEVNETIEKFISSKGVEEN